jgi:hypothetical protein
MMELYQRVEATSHLGREFLTWLWFESERNGGVFQAAEVPVEVIFDAKLTLASTGTLKEESVIKSERPTDVEEARVSLQSGKQVEEARLRLTTGQKYWSLTVKAQDLSLHGVKLPALLGATDEDAIYERLALLEECQDLVDGLFGSFVERRLNTQTWSAEAEAIRAWVQAPREGR